jgi:hypothetical protein
MKETSMPSKLPDGWIQRIFATMQGNYGTRFMNQWKTGQALPDGSDAGVVNAMNHWAEKMGGTSAATIKRALEQLPEEPPSLPQWMALLRRCYVEPSVLRLGNDLTAEQMATNKRRIAELIASVKNNV